MQILVSKTKPGAEIPARQTVGASGWDLHAIEDTVIMPGACTVVGIGLAFDIPEGWEGQLRPRSSMSLQGVTLSLGTIDSDYRGEVGLILNNTTGTPYDICSGDRIAQIVFTPVPPVDMREVPYNELTRTDRNYGGFGSTGV